MRFSFFLFLILISTTTYSQILDKNLLIGRFVLDKLEISQQFDSNRIKLPPLSWSLYTQPGFNDSLYILENFAFKRSMNFQNTIKQTFQGALILQSDTLRIAEGYLFSENKLKIEFLDHQKMILIERFPMRCVRRTFKRVDDLILKP
jgi:hypothetical protein